MWCLNSCCNTELGKVWKKIEKINEKMSYVSIKLSTNFGFGLYTVNNSASFWNYTPHPMTSQHTGLCFWQKNEKLWTLFECNRCLSSWSILMVPCSVTFLISGQITQHDTTINIKLNRNESQNYQNKTNIVINQKYLGKKRLGQEM